MRSENLSALTALGSAVGGKPYLESVDGCGTYLGSVVGGGPYLGSVEGCEPRILGSVEDGGPYLGSAVGPKRDSA